MKKIKRSFTWRGAYIVLWVLIYLWAIHWVSTNWKSFMEGGEPIRQAVLNNPSIDKITAEREAFRAQYFKGCILTLLAALLSYLVFFITCRHSYDSSLKKRKRWRRMIIYVNIQFFFLIWSNLFYLPLPLITREQFLPFVLSFIAVTAGIFFFTATLTNLANKNTPGLPLIFYSAVYSFVAVFLSSNTAAGIAQDLLESIAGVREIPTFSTFLDIINYLSDPFIGTIYTLKLPIQFLISLVPVIPVLMLMQWCWLCMPRSVGVAPNAGRHNPFICLDK